jgi:hypothetical protein
MELSESTLNYLIASRKGDLEELQQSEMKRDEVYYLLMGQHQGFIQALEILTDLIKKEEL